MAAPSAPAAPAETEAILAAINQQAQQQLNSAVKKEAESKKLQAEIRMLKERKEQVDKELQADFKQFHSLKIIAKAIEKNPKGVIFYMIQKKQWDALMFALKNDSEFGFGIHNQDPTSLSDSLYKLVSDYCECDIVQCVKLIVERCCITKEIAKEAYTVTTFSPGCEHGWEAIEQIKIFLEEKFSY